MFPLPTPLSPLVTYQSAINSLGGILAGSSREKPLYQVASGV